jgi:hypothetical protein
LILAKEELEKLTESIIKKVVNNSTLDESSMTMAGAFTIESRTKKASSEVVKGAINDMREMSEVMRELTSLIVGVL